MLLSFRRQILWETPFLPTPGSVSVPTSRPPSLVPPPCLFAASPHAPEWLQFWGAMSCFPFWERGKRQCLPRVVHSLLRIGHPAAPHTLLFMPDEASCMSIIFSCRLMELSLTTKLLFWQRNRALGRSQRNKNVKLPTEQEQHCELAWEPWSLGHRHGYREELSAFVFMPHLWCAWFCF